MLTWDDFAKVDMRVGTIIDAKIFPEVRKPAYKLWIDFGKAVGIKKTSAQITERYTPKFLVGTQVIAVINFPTKQIANFMSECLVLGVIGSNDGVVLLQPDQKIKNGLKVS